MIPVHLINTWTAWRWNFYIWTTCKWQDRCKIYTSIENIYIHALMFFWCRGRRTFLKGRTKEFVIHVGCSVLWHRLPDTPTYHSTRTFTRGAGIRFKSNYTSEFRYKVRFMVHILKPQFFSMIATIT